MNSQNIRNTEDFMKYAGELFPADEMQDLERKNKKVVFKTDYKIQESNPVDQKYVIQPNNITRAIYDMNLGSKRIIMMACSLLLERDENGVLTTKKDLTVKFRLEDVMRSLHLTHGSTTKRMLEDAIETIFDQKIRIRTDDGWTQLYHWFNSSNYSEEANGFNLTFTPEVAKAFVEYLNGYSVINLDVYGNLTGKYSIRMYEYCWSYHNFKNKKDGRWETPMISIKELRTMWMIDDSKYPVMSDFKKRVIEVSKDEINRYENSQFTLEDVEYFKQGCKIVACKFHCKLNSIKTDPLKSLNPSAGKTNDEILSEHNEEVLKLFKEMIAAKKAELENDPERLNKENDIFQDTQQIILDKYKK